MTQERMMQTIEAARDVATARRVFGEPQTIGDTTVIPIAAVTHAYGFGYGGGPERTDERGNAVTTGGGGGAGGQTTARPVAVLEVTRDATIVKPIEDKTRIALAGIAMVAWNVFWVMKTIRAIAKARSK
ncbi:MAG: spore germination protein GerW family protein [Chloroflexota bacterium]